MEDQRVVSRTRAEQFASRVNAIMYETSAKENVGVEEIFKKISEEVRHRGYRVYTQYHILTYNI